MLALLPLPELLCFCISERSRASVSLLTLMPAFGFFAEPEGSS